MFDTLQKLGLSETEAGVYETIIEEGPCFVAPIVKRTKKHRQIVYNALESLEEKKLIAQTRKNGKNFYGISDPTRLLLDIKQKEVLASNLVEYIQKRILAEKELVEVFSGEESYTQAIKDFRRRAREAREYVVIRAECKGWFEKTRDFFNDHVEELRKMNIADSIDILIVFFEHERNLASQFIGPYIKNPYICKIVPDEYKLPNTVWLAGEHVYILTPSVDPLVVHIHSKILADQYRESFWRIWKKGTIL